MLERTVVLRRRASKSPTASPNQRRIVATPARATRLSLPDCPHALHLSRDGKWVFAAIPYGVLVIPRSCAHIERSLDLPHERSCVWEDENAQLWIGGHHLYKAHAFSGPLRKIGTKLAGYVEQIVGLSHNDHLFGVGSQGEVLLSRKDASPVHQAKLARSHQLSLTLLPQDRPVFSSHTRHALLVDPRHLQGHTKVNLPAQDSWENPQQALNLVYCDPKLHPDRLFLAAQDGAVAWTGPGLTMQKALYLSKTRAGQPALALFADRHWLYVLRERGVLHRFLISPPPLKESKPARGKARAHQDPWPPAQKAKLAHPARAMTGWQHPDSMATALLLAGPLAQGHLGQIWQQDPEKLEWEGLGLASRTLQDPPEPTASVPNFVATRHRFEGEPLQTTLSVDRLLSDEDGFWVTGSQANLIQERPIQAVCASALMPQDSVILAAMLRFANGQARPGFVLWSARGDKPSLRYFAWGQEPRAWIELQTPMLREQSWPRPQVFPLQVALRAPLEDSWPMHKDPRYDPIPRSYRDPELFAAMAKECKTQMIVLW